MGLVAAVVFMAWRVVQQQRTRPFRDVRHRLWFWALSALAVLGAGAGVMAAPPTTRWGAAASVIIICGIAVMGGALRGRTVRLWMSASGQIMRKGTVVTTASWLVWCIVHLGRDRGLGILTADPTLSTTTLYAGIALSLAAQAAVLSRRSQPQPA